MKKNATEGSDDSAETKALQAQIAELTEALASQAKDLAAKDDALAKQPRRSSLWHAPTESDIAAADMKP